MYRIKTIQDDLAKVNGWRQHYNPSSKLRIDESLTVSDFNRYYQGFHPMLTLDNCRDIAPDFPIEEINNWAVGDTYPVDDLVAFNTKTYRALSTTIGQSPDSSPLAWREVDLFSEWLDIKTKESIASCISTFWDQKIKDKTAKHILENKTLFNGAGRLADIITPTGGLVGFELVPLRTFGVTTKINKIGLQFTGTGPMKVYLFHSSQEQAIKVYTLSRTKNRSVEWFDLDEAYLPYVSTNNDAGGSWYLVYNESDMPEGVQAIKKDKDWSKGPCGDCDRDEVMGYNIWSKYLEVHPFKVAYTRPDLSDFNDDFNDDFANQEPNLEVLLWDIKDNLYTYTNNYGLNLQISIECDVTDLIIENRQMFQNLLGLHVAIDFLREFAFNPNFNITRTTKNLTKAEILYEIDGDSMSNKKSGLMHQYQTALKAAKINMSSLSRVCLSCSNKGLRHKTI